MNKKALLCVQALTLNLPLFERCDSSRWPTVRRLRIALSKEGEPFHRIIFTAVRTIECDLFSFIVFLSVVGD